MYGYPENKRASLPVLSLQRPFQRMKTILKKMFSVTDDRWPNGGKRYIQAILGEERSLAGQEK